MSTTGGSDFPDALTISSNPVEPGADERDGALVACSAERLRGGMAAREPGTVTAARNAGEADA